jgi:hypothetical protein
MPSERGTAAARRRAATVAAVAGLALAPWFYVAVSVGKLRTESPTAGAPMGQYVDFYVDNFSRIPVRATAFIVQWAIILVLLVAVVRAACRRLDLAAIVSIGLAGAATAVYVVAEGIGAWPVHAATDMTAERIHGSLDPGVAQALVLSRDGLHAAAAVLLGISLLIIAWLVARSDLWGHPTLAALTGIAGVSASASMLLGPEFIGVGALLPWGIGVAVVMLVARRRLDGTPAAATPGTPPDAAGSA